MNRFLHVQEYLSNHTLEQLAADHGVHAHIQGHKASFNYDQILSRHDDPLACQCRGLILSTPNGTTFTESEIVGKTLLLARPFDRFFNYGQAEVATVDMKSARVYEKLDGTLCICYFDPFMAQWCVATRSIPNGDNTVAGGNLTFRKMFELAAGCTLDSLFLDVRKKFTYLFELIGPLNRVVVQYEKIGATLLGAVETSSGSEISPEMVCLPGAPTPKTYSLSSLGGILELANKLDPLQNEGFVVVDRDFNRMKVKSPLYFAQNELSFEAKSSPRNLMRILLRGQDDDAESLLTPTFQEMLRGMRGLFAPWIVDLDSRIKDGISSIKNIEDPREQRKQYAIYCNTTGLWIGPAMAIYAGKADSVLDWIRQREATGGLVDFIMHEIGFHVVEYLK